MPTEPQELTSTRRWLEDIVIALNLCPFAKRELNGERVRFVLSKSQSEQGLLTDLQREFDYLLAHPKIETSLLVHPQVLKDFDHYNQFLDLADALLDSFQLDGVLQIASFHPRYQFAGTAIDEAQNYTNRSPYPLLHILREDSVTQAVKRHPDAEQIPHDNIALMERLGTQTLHRKLSTLT